MNRFVLWFVKLTGYPIQFFYFRKKIYYEDKKSQSRKIKGGALIVSNHTSLYDYPLIMYTFLARSIRTVASEILYNKGKLMAWFLNKIGCIKADRDAHDFSFMSTMNKYLKKKQVGLVFPEARLPREGETELLEFKPSFVYMALEAHVPIIPVYTNGIYGKEKKRKKDRAKIIVGKKIYLEELLDDSKSEKENIEFLCGYVRDYILKLKDQIE